MHPMSKHRLPIYHSLRLDHFETPRHFRDHIRDSELLRFIKMHKLIIIVIVTLSVRTLRFENNVDMTETRLRSITNSGTWMPILAPTYSTKIFYRSDRITTYVVPFVHRYVTCPRFDHRYPIPSSISLPASLFTRFVIHHPATNSLVAMLARLK